MIEGMARDHPPPHGPRFPTNYRLEVQGPVPAALAEQLDGFTLDAGPTSTLTGAVADSAALYGLITRLEGLGLTLLSIQPCVDTSTPRVLEHTDAEDVSRQQRDA